jgi:DNA-binding transcriptional ArsR family regulator
MKNITDEDAIWRALAEPIRRKILDLLAAAPRTTGELVSHFDSLCRTGVMKHLEVLVLANLVIVQKSGRTRWNHLNPVPIEQVCQRWVDGHVKRLAKSMTRLKSLLEEAPDPESPIQKKAKRKCNA